MFLFTSALSLVTHEARTKNVNNEEKKQRLENVRRKPTTSDEQAPLKLKDFFLYPRFTINNGIAMAMARRTPKGTFIFLKYF